MAEAATSTPDISASMSGVSGGAEQGQTPQAGSDPDGVPDEPASAEDQNFQESASSASEDEPSEAGLFSVQSPASNSDDGQNPASSGEAGGE